MSDGKNRKIFEIFDADEFIATITQQIPDKSFQRVRYYGWYSNRARGTRRKQQLLMGDVAPDTDAVEVLTITEPSSRKIPSKTLARMHQEGRGGRSAGMPALRLGDEDCQLHR
jgi:hypothetical protein